MVQDSRYDFKALRGIERDCWKAVNKAWRGYENKPKKIATYVQICNGQTRLVIAYMSPIAGKGETYSYVL